MTEPGNELGSIYVIREIGSLKETKRKLVVTHALAESHMKLRRVNYTSER